MKKITFMVAIMFCSLVSFAQSSLKLKHPQLYKIVPERIENAPKWVTLLYSDHPNIDELEAAFVKYYRSHPFSKTIHTSNYKYFMRQVRNHDLLDVQRNLYIPTLEKQEERTEKLKETRRSQTKKSGAWTAVGPMRTLHLNGSAQKSAQVNIYTLDQSQSNPNIVFAGAETWGVYKSVNKGDSWVSVGDDTFNDGGIGVVKIDPNNADIVYVGVGNKLYKTTNGGANWTQLLNVSGLGLSAMTINPNNTQQLLIVGGNGLRRSVDGGSSWTTIYTDRCWDVQLKTDDPNTVFLAKQNTTKKITEIWKSTDGGQTFTVKNNGWFAPIGGVAQSDGGARIGVTNADSNRLYVILLGEENDAVVDNNYIGIYRSDNAAELWSTPYDGNNDGNPDNEPGGPYSDDHWCFTHFGVTTTGYNQGFYDLAIGVSDTNADHFMVGSLNLFKSEDGGKRYTRWGGYGCTGCGNEYRHPDIQDIQINGNDVWVASDGGVDLYDGQLNFVSGKNNGLNGSSYWGFDQGWNYDVFAGGRYHNGNAGYYQSYPGGDFLSLGGAESATGYINKGENRKLYHSDISAKELPETITGTIKNISSYSMYPTEHYVFSRRSEIVNHPSYWNILFLGKEHKLWKSDDGGGSFTALKTFGTDAANTVKAIEVSRVDPKVIFVTQKVGNSGKLWKTTDGGANWVEVIIPAAHQTMYLSLSTKNELYLALNNGYNNGNKVFKSTDLGASWQNLSTSALNGEWIENIQVQDGTNGGVYLTSNKTVWYRNNSHSDWQLFSNGLPLHFRICKILPFYRDGKIRIAGNRGIWERSLYEVSKPYAQPMVSTKTVHCDREEVQFEDYSILNHSGASWAWQFPGATSVSSTTIRNPKVIYTTPGTYDVMLTITDGAGETSTRTIQNMITVGQNYCATEPDPQQALSCEVASQYVTNETVNINNISNFTFTGWVKPNGVQADYSGIFSLSDGAVLNFREGNNTLGIHWPGPSAYWWYDSNLIVPANEWSFVAIAVTPTSVTLYVNEQKHTWNITTNPFNLNRIQIGTYYGWNSRSYKGLIEEATFWKRTLTDQEIRLSRHLTKSDISDADLIAYYQFNHVNGAKIYDKKGGYDLQRNLAVGLKPSDAPVGPGTSKLLNITSGGIKDFTTANAKLVFNNSGSVPNGEVVVSNINIAPSALPTTNVFQNKYWVINNYGSNQNFTGLTDIQFSNVSGLGTSEIASNLRLYKRNSNAQLTDSWGTAISTASVINTTANTANFPTTMNTFSQFYIGLENTLTIENNSNENAVLYPNPVISGSALNIKGLEGKKRITLIDATGKIVLHRSMGEAEELQIPQLAEGVYIYQLETEQRMINGKLLIK